ILLILTDFSIQEYVVGIYCLTPSPLLTYIYIKAIFIDKMKTRITCSCFLCVFGIVANTLHRLEVILAVLIFHIDCFPVSKVILRKVPYFVSKNLTVKELI